MVTIQQGIPFKPERIPHIVKYVNASIGGFSFKIPYPPTAFLLDENLKACFPRNFLNINK